jgi:multidrug efflux pump subunit AcrB
MVRFLIERPIAVSMVFLALALLGLVTTTSLPVSLMPDIDIPVITVRVNAPEMPARQLENSVVKPLRATLKEVARVEEMKSEAHDGSAWVELRFRHGTPVNLASVEVNEKVDKAMNYLPRNISRPEVVRASASDLPVFYLLITKTNEGNTTNNGQNITSELTEVAAPMASATPVAERRLLGAVAAPMASAPLSHQCSHLFLELSNFAGQVIRKRLEQLPEVALVDMSGLAYPEIRITPKPELLASDALSLPLIERALNENNAELGNLLIRDGQYQYNVRFNTRLRNLDDVRNTPLNLNGRILTLAEVATVEQLPETPIGNVRFNGQPAISLAVIKQANARMATLEKELQTLIGHFRNDYPDVEFHITRDQTQLLKYSISNLGQSLIVGGLLAFLAMFVFLRERRAPWLIGISIPVSLIISLLIFYLTGLSINIISLSGLVLGIGMMVDNSIIVIDNITQYRQRGDSLADSCVNGSNEVIRPLISSVLTTCAVFVPLIFMQGMAGALFFDQAMAVAIGLAVSLVVAITLLPMLYRLIYSSNKTGSAVTHAALGQGSDAWYFHFYEKGLKGVLRHQAAVWAMVILSLGASVLLWNSMPFSRFPAISHSETVLDIDWNEPVTLHENNRRVSLLMAGLQPAPVYVVEETGRQQYLLSVSEASGTAETRVHVKMGSPDELSLVTDQLAEKIAMNYPAAEFAFSDADNLLNLAFGKEEPPLVARFAHPRPGDAGYMPQMEKLQQTMESSFPGKVTSRMVSRNLVMLQTHPERMMLYKVNPAQLSAEIRSAFNNNTVFTITGSDMLVPVKVGHSYRSVYDVVQNLTVRNSEGEQIPLSGLVTVSHATDLKTITADRDNEYFGVDLELPARQVAGAMSKIRQLPMVNERSEGLTLSFGGSAIASQKLLREMLIIIAISLLLLYFILAAQFESFLLPLIVLIEVPLDLFGVLLLLKLFGAGINLMSAIGIIVMTGIVINDSILKIDTVNRMVLSGTPVLRAIVVAGRRRLKPILMTSITTMLAISPFLFQGGMGAELQKPLSLAIIGGIGFGTLVSLYFIPLMYYALVRVKKI